MTRHWRPSTPWYTRRFSGGARSCSRRRAQRGDAIVVNDIPLLFEVLDPRQFDVVVLVDAPAALRRTRLRASRGLSGEEADRMIAAQMPAERKRGRSAFVIDNAGTRQELERAAKAVYKELRRLTKAQPSP
jgi:dephospho-CoA kinase